MIMPISTSGIGNMDISSSASKAKSKAEEKAMDAFASLMNMTAGVSNETPSDISTELDTTSTTELSDSSIKTEYELKDEPYKDDVVKTEKIKTEDKISVENKTVDNTKEGNTTDNIATASEVINTLKNMIMDNLNITEEELNNLLDDMNIELCDLLSADIFKDFVLISQNCTNVDLLINEDVSNLVNDLNAKLQEIIDTYDIEDVTEFIDFIKDNVAEIETNTSFEQEVFVEVKSELKAETKVVTEDTVESKETKTVINTNDNQTTNNQAEDSSDFGTDNQTEEQSYQPHSKETTSNPVINNLNQALNNAFTTNGLEAVPTYATSVSEADIVRQIIDQIKVNITKETTSLEVQLNPANLGKVQINVASKDGIITAQIITENEAAKHAIENSLAVLKETFNNQELKVEAVEVMIASYEFFNQGQDAQFEEEQTNTSNTSGNINLSDGFSEDELSDEQQLQVEVMRQQGSSVNYSI